MKCYLCISKLNHCQPNIHEIVPKITICTILELKKKNMFLFDISFSGGGGHVSTLKCGWFTLRNTEKKMKISLCKLNKILEIKCEYFDLIEWQMRTGWNFGKYVSLTSMQEHINEKTENEQANEKRKRTNIR